MEKTEKLIMQEDAWKPLKEMNLTDDFLFDVATTELENCKTIIELSTGLRLKSLKWKEGQKVVHNIPGKRGIRMDFVAESEDGRVFDVEMQNRKEGNIPKRTRFYQALMDAPLLKSGEKGFDKLKPLFIICFVIMIRMERRSIVIHLKTDVKNSRIYCLEMRSQNYSSARKGKMQMKYRKSW